MLGDLNAGQDGLGQLFSDEVPQSARLSAVGCNRYLGNAKKGPQGGQFKEMLDGHDI